VRVANVRDVNDWMLDRELVRPGAPVLVLYHGLDRDGTRPARAAFRTAARRHVGSARFLQLNVNENPSVMERRRVRALPIVVGYAEGRETARRRLPLDADAVLDLLSAKPEEA
jgi:thioredoxin-like negative regulator of GroEL